MKKLSKILLSGLMSVLLFVPVFVQAEGAQSGQINTGTVATIEPTVKEDQELIGTDFNDLTGTEYVEKLQQGTVNIDDVGDKVLNKLNEVVVFLQKAMYFISIIGFIVGGILILTGAISKRATIMPGIITCVAAVVSYTIGMYAPQLITALSTWFIE